MEKFIEEFREDIKSFREMTEKFYNKELSVKDYKGFSGGFGSYAQKGGAASMLRLRMPAGRMTKEMLKFIVDSIDKYNIKKAHFTTCQTVQFHDLPGDVAGEIMEQAIDVGIYTRGGGGDFPRNVMCSPLSGVEEGEYFDVLPYAKAVSDFLLGFIKTVKMPRKLKVGFSNSPDNVTHATFRDLGFAATKDGKFDVYIAGGLGNNPRMGVKVAENIEPSEILYYVKAMIDIFVEHGNYENRGKARTRYLQETLGEDLREVYLGKLAIVKSAEKLEFKTENIKYTESGNNIKVTNPRILPQKQEGLYSVVYHPVGGIPPVTKFREIYNVIESMSQVECRVSPDESFYIINLTGDEAEKVLEVTGDGAANLFETSVSCIGATICQIGLRDSQGLLMSIVEKCREYDFRDGVLPRIHISGCTSSCGTHQIGTLGFHGGVKRVNDVVEPAFTFHVNGCDIEGEERFGQQWGMMLQKEIPDFFVELGKAVSDENMTFDKWFEKNPQKLKDIAQKYLYQ